MYGPGRPPQSHLWWLVVLSLKSNQISSKKILKLRFICTVSATCSLVCARLLSLDPTSCTVLWSFFGPLLHALLSSFLFLLLLLLLLLLPVCPLGPNIRGPVPVENPDSPQETIKVLISAARGPLSAALPVTLVCYFNRPTIFLCGGLHFSAGIFLLFLGIFNLLHFPFLVCMHCSEKKHSWGKLHV